MKKRLFSPKPILLVAMVFALVPLPGAQDSDRARWQQQARNVTIVRDDWGIAHVYAATDAEAVFGALYAQAEDDFNRVETNYLNAMGRLAEAEGESAIYQDLRMKLFISPAELKKQYAASPPWLQKLMIAFADGLNFYLAQHPAVKPRAIAHFEPWMALSFTEGSIGGDIERINLRQLEAFYGGPEPRPSARTVPPAEAAPVEPSGSNGVAIAPTNTANRHALLLINPHTSFFFRSELQMVSGEGLNAYGASTWGQFFIYQGFNDRVGWMHTSSAVDDLDEYLETVARRDGRFYYRYGNEERPVTAETIVVPYRTSSAMAEKRFTVYRTHHGPVIRLENGKWVAIRLMQDPVHALTQSYSRTKAKNYAAFRQTMELHTNSTNNTIYADADGNIAYFHANFIPRRDPKFDWTRPVDGSTAETEWKGLLSVDESPNLFNPKSGWLYNANNWPWSAAGPGSPRQADYPPYVDSGSESPRGLHAIRVLQDKRDFTLDSLIAAAFDRYLTGFEKPIPALIAAWERTPASDPLKRRTAAPIELLRRWDLHWGVDSVPTTLAVMWGEEVQRRAAAAAGGRNGRGSPWLPVESLTAGQLVEALAAACDRLQADFGTWQTPWGEINRFQRLTGAIVQPFNDSGASIPVGFTASQWGSLAAFGARTYPGTRKRYGTSGNSFVAVVEFGPTVSARAVTAGGVSGHPESKHFNDEAGRYASGDLRPVYFYRSQLKGHTEREYHPGN